MPFWKRRSNSALTPNSPLIAACKTRSRLRSPCSPPPAPRSPRSPDRASGETLHTTSPWARPAARSADERADVGCRAPWREAGPPAPLRLNHMPSRPRSLSDPGAEEALYDSITEGLFACRLPSGQDEPVADEAPRRIRRRARAVEHCMIERFLGYTCGRMRTVAAGTISKKAHRAIGTKAMAGTPLRSQAMPLNIGTITAQV